MPNELVLVTYPDGRQAWLPMSQVPPAQLPMQVPPHVVYPYPVNQQYPPPYQQYQPTYQQPYARPRRRRKSRGLARPAIVCLGFVLSWIPAAFGSGGGTVLCWGLLFTYVVHLAFRKD